MKRPLRPASLALAILALASAGPAPAGEAEAPAIKLVDCKLTAPGTVRRVEAECGTWTVLEDRANPQGAKIDLRIAIVRARAKAKQKAPDPLFLLAGGPGQAATESYVGMEGAFERVLRKRDVVLLDQRGTGGSNAMQCEFDQDWEPEDLDTNLDRQVQWFKDCLAKLPGDARFYTTSVAIDDLDAVRVALGYREINLWGGSYGTRVALAYLRKYPGSTRSVVIDGVAPMDLTLGPNISLESQRAADQMFARCAADAACAKAFPNLAQDFDALIERLRDKPVKLEMRDPISGALDEVTLTYEGAASAVRMLLYSTESVSLLPLIIHAAAEGDYAPLAAQASLVTRRMSSMINIGMHNAVICAEDAPYFSDDPAERKAMRETYLGSFSTDVLKAACAIWPKGPVDAGFKDPVTSDKPVLLLSGAIDPITPPANAEHALKTLGNARHFVAPNQGHIVTMRGCAPKLVAEFIEGADPKALDGGCLDTLHGAPFFVRFSGPEP